MKKYIESKDQIIREQVESWKHSILATLEKMKPASNLAFLQGLQRSNKIKPEESKFGLLSGGQKLFVPRKKFFPPPEDDNVPKVDELTNPEILYPQPSAPMTFVESLGGDQDLVILQRQSTVLETDHYDGDSDNSSEPNETCPICMDEGELTVRLQCGHKFCRECIVGHVESKVNEGSLPIFCPMPKCGTVSIVDEVHSLLSDTMFVRFTELEMNQNVAVIDEIKHCLTPDCRNVLYLDPGVTHFSCEVCKKEYCIECQGPAHPLYSCKVAQLMNRRDQTNKEIDPAKQYLRENNCRKCPGCKSWVERSEGCNHMTCRCKFEFCFRCGGPWKNRSCDCRLFDRDNDNRRYLPNPDLEDLEEVKDINAELLNLEQEEEQLAIIQSEMMHQTYFEQQMKEQMHENLQERQPASMAFGWPQEQEEQEDLMDEDMQLALALSYKPKI